MKPVVLSLIAVSVAACTQAKPTADTPGAYMIVSGKNYEAKDLGPYAAKLPPIYAKYGGHYIAFSSDYTIVEGNLDAQAVIISAWPDIDAAKTFWNSPEYQKAMELREGIGEFDVVILPALPRQK